MDFNVESLNGSIDFEKDARAIAVANAIKILDKYEEQVMATPTEDIKDKYKVEDEPQSFEAPQNPEPTPVPTVEPAESPLKDATLNNLTSEANVGGSFDTTSFMDETPTAPVTEAQDFEVVKATDTFVDDLNKKMNTEQTAIPESPEEARTVSLDSSTAVAEQVAQVIESAPKNEPVAASEISKTLEPGKPLPVKDFVNVEMSVPNSFAPQATPSMPTVEHGSDYAVSTPSANLGGVKTDSPGLNMFQEAFNEFSEALNYNNQLQGRVVSLEKVADNLMKDNARLQSDGELKEQALNSARTEAEIGRKETEKYKRELAKSNERITELEAELARVTDEKRQIETLGNLNLDEQRAETEKKQEEIDKLKGQIDIYLGTIEQQKEDRKNIESDINDQLITLKTEKKDLAEKLKQTQEQLSQAEERIDSLESQLSLKDRELFEARDELSVRESEAENLREEHSRKDQEITNLRAETTAAKAETEEVRKQFEYQAELRKMAEDALENQIKISYENKADSQSEQYAQPETAKDDTVINIYPTGSDTEESYQTMEEPVVESELVVPETVSLESEQAEETNLDVEPIALDEVALETPQTTSKEPAIEPELIETPIEEQQLEIPSSSLDGTSVEPEDFKVIETENGAIDFNATKEANLNDTKVDVETFKVPDETELAASHEETSPLVGINLKDMADADTKPNYTDEQLEAMIDNMYVGDNTTPGGGETQAPDYQRINKAA